MKIKSGKNVSLSQIMDSLKSADVNHVFGDPVEKYGKTIIPVGKVQCSFGYGFGGSGQDDNNPLNLSDGENITEEKKEGIGGGGGASFNIKPVGYIEITPSSTKFVKTPLFSFKSAMLGASFYKMGTMFGLWLAWMIYLKKKDCCK